MHAVTHITGYLEYLIPAKTQNFAALCVTLNVTHLCMEHNLLVLFRKQFREKTLFFGARMSNHN